MSSEKDQNTISLEKIATCAELLTEILTDNRETINLMFKSTKTLVKFNEKYMKKYEKLYPDEKDDNLPNIGVTVDEKYDL